MVNATPASNGAFTTSLTFNQPAAGTVAVVGPAVNEDHAPRYVEFTVFVTVPPDVHAPGSATSTAVNVVAPTPVTAYVPLYPEGVTPVTTTVLPIANVCAVVKEKVTTPVAHDVPVVTVLVWVWSHLKYFNTLAFVTVDVPGSAATAYRNVVDRGTSNMVNIPQ
jgi:hypothetical protein